MERYRDRRSPDRSGRERQSGSTGIDSYIPATSSRASRPRSRSPSAFRARSRTPPPRAADSYRGRPPSPPRRYEPRADSYTSRDARQRSPRRDQTAPDLRQDEAARASRDRSPRSLKRTRETSPASDYTRAKSPLRRRTPPRDSRTTYRPRSRSPRRDERLDPYASRFRPRSQSPKGDSGKNSSATSRRSSPRPQTRRAFDIAATDDVRSASNHRSPRNRSPLGQHESPASRTRTPYREDASGNSYSRDSAGSDGRDRPPYAGHSSNRDSQAPVAIPTGPSSSSLPSSGPVRSGPPSGPGYGRGGYGGYRGRGGGPPAGRGQASWGVAAAYNRASAGGGPPPSAGSGTASPSARDSHGGLPRRGSSYGGSPHPSFRGSGNGTSTTTPRTQRFSQAMLGIPEIKPGGEKLPPLHDTSKAERLEEEAARLRKLIDDKEMKKRQGLKEWDRLERDSANAALRSELAEEHLRSLNGDGEGMAAAF